MRGHRLWEIFLQREASLAPDHVHAGAEEIEHFLDAETLRELEDLLDNPETDPHGKLIPPGETP
jgi:Mn-dependent DtxR family transcriptional regulator